MSGELMKPDERYDVSSHFEFGKNWQSYLTTLTDEKVKFAEKGLTDLVPEADLNGISFGS